jgi:hypothetical protein
MKNNPLILLILMMTACSENFQEQKIELIVDQKIIIKDKIKGSPVPSESDYSNLLIRHIDDIRKIDLACEAAIFISAKYAFVENNSTFLLEKSKKNFGKADKKINYSTTQSVSPINMKNSILKCRSQYDSDTSLSGCVLLKNTSKEKVQPQYFLNLKDHMEERYGMKESATFKIEILEKFEGSKRYALDEVKITKDSIQCDSSISD